MAQSRPADITPSLSYAIEASVQQILSDVHVCMPGVVQSYDKDSQTAAVQPALKRGYDENGQITVVNLPQIINVPVVHPRAGDAWIHLPIKAGDSVTLIFSERSLDVWKAQAGIVDPADRRKFNLTDAFAFPGGYSPVEAISPDDSDALQLKNSLANLKMNPDGTFSIGNGTVELMETLVDLLDTLINANVLTMLGPQPFLASTLAQLQVLKTKLEQLKV